MQENSRTEDRGDRWSRSDWWGVVLDAPDVGVLARFYSELRGWPIWKQDVDGAALDLGEGVAYLGIQHHPDYVRPVWPAAPGCQQMMVHLDFEVTDLEEAVAHAVRLGAQLPNTNRRTTCGSSSTLRGTRSACTHSCCPRE